jgi:hypothetical protein
MEGGSQSCHAMEGFQIILAECVEGAESPSNVTIQRIDDKIRITIDLLSNRNNASHSHNLNSKTNPKLIHQTPKMITFNR